MGGQPFNQEPLLGKRVLSESKVQVVSRQKLNGDPEDAADIESTLARPLSVSF